MIIRVPHALVFAQASLLITRIGMGTNCPPPRFSALSLNCLLPLVIVTTSTKSWMWICAIFTHTGSPCNFLSQGTQTPAATGVSYLCSSISAHCAWPNFIQGTRQRSAILDLFPPRSFRKRVVDTLTAFRVDSGSKSTLFNQTLDSLIPQSVQT